MTPEEREKVAAIKASPSYIPAYEDVSFLNQWELRPVRLELELLKVSRNEQRWRKPANPS